MKDKCTSFNFAGIVSIPVYDLAAQPAMPAKNTKIAFYILIIA